MSTPEGTTGPTVPTVPGESAIRELVELAERGARGRRAGVRDDRIGWRSRPSRAPRRRDAMDLASEELLRVLLGAGRPDDGLLGEEAGLRPGTSGLTWVVDPIDGTVNYLYGIPAYAVSVAVVIGDRPDPAAGGRSPAACTIRRPGETWTAGRRLGAFLNGRRLLLTGDPPALARALVATGFGYRAERRANQARVWPTLLPRVRDLRRVGWRVDRPVHAGHRSGSTPTSSAGCTPGTSRPVARRAGGRRRRDGARAALGPAGDDGRGSATADGVAAARGLDPRGAAAPTPGA